MRDLAQLQAGCKQRKVLLGADRYATALIGRYSTHLPCAYTCIGYCAGMRHMQGTTRYNINGVNGAVPYWQ